MNNYRNKFSLENKTIVVTGACGLLGKEICRALADLQARVVLADINMEAARQFQVELQSTYGGPVLALPLDIRSEDSVKQLLYSLQQQSLEVDGLVNNAYPRNATYGTAFENIPLESWRENVDMHLNGYFNMSQQTARVMMKQNHGCIINMASIYGLLGPDFRVYEGTSMTMPAEYSAIKGGVINLTRYMATYLAPFNIRVNSLSAGGIFDGQAQSFVERYCQKTPMGRMGIPEDIAAGVLFLISDLSGYITGQNLVIDGGWSAW